MYIQATTFQAKMRILTTETFTNFGDGLVYSWNSSNSFASRRVDKLSCSAKILHMPWNPTEDSDHVHVMESNQKRSVPKKLFLFL